MSRSSDVLLDGLIALWLTLCAVAFWGPYVGVVLSPGLANALYAAFLLSVIGIVLVRWLKSRTDAEKGVRAAAGESEKEGQNGGSGR